MVESWNNKLEIVGSSSTLGNFLCCYFYLVTSERLWCQYCQPPLVAKISISIGFCKVFCWKIANHLVIRVKEIEHIIETYFERKLRNVWQIIKMFSWYTIIIFSCDRQVQLKYVYVTSFTTLTKATSFYGWASITNTIVLVSRLHASIHDLTISRIEQALRVPEPPVQSTVTRLIKWRNNISGSTGKHPDKMATPRPWKDFIIVQLHNATVKRHTQWGVITL